MKASDNSIIEKWRSETLRSIVATSGYDKYRDQLTHEVSISLEDVLRSAFPVLAFFDNAFVKLQTQIVEPALELAIITQTSPMRYKFTPRITYPPFKSTRVSFPQSLNRAIIKDIETRKTLTQRSPVTINEYGSIGNYAMLIEPGLVRCGNESREKVVVRKFQSVVVLDVPLTKGQKKPTHSKPGEGMN
ncbi:hypothetical protein MMC13_005293 [Lambiella insularis]|nr:hypothetical protein [Lambiella insularis]